MDTVPGSRIDLVPYPGGPRLPLGLASGCRACTQTSQPLFVQAKASPPPPGQLALDQWPGAMAGASGPCPLWPVAPGAMGLPLGSGQHCDCAQVNSPEAGDRQCPPRPAPPRPWAPWRLAGRCRRPELSPEACCLVTFLPGYSPWSPRAGGGGKDGGLCRGACVVHSGAPTGLHTWTGETRKASGPREREKEAGPTCSRDRRGESGVQGGVWCLFCSVRNCLNFYLVL